MLCWAGSQVSSGRVVLDVLSRHSSSRQGHDGWMSTACFLLSGAHYRACFNIPIVLGRDILLSAVWSPVAVPRHTRDAIYYN